MSQPSYDTRGHSDFSDRSIDPVLTKLRHCRSKPKRRPPLVTPVPKSGIYHNLKPPRRVHVCLLNCHSVKNKAQPVKDYIVDSHIDILGITETWLSKREKDKAVIKILSRQGTVSIMSPAQRA